MNDSSDSDISTMTAGELLRLHEINDADLELVRKFGTLMVPKLEQYIDHFYNWLEKLPDFSRFFDDKARLRRVQQSQISYWKVFFEARVDEDFIRERRRVGEVHAQIGLSLTSYFAGMNISLIIYTKQLYDGGLYSEEYSAIVTAMTKLLHLDTTLVVDTYSRIMGRRITEQSRALLEMSTPVTQIWQDILMLPIVGIIDSKRAQDIMSSVLEKIKDSRAKIFIMDISGVAVVDTAVANHFIKISKAARLMGCTCLVSGISPSIAQTMVHLGINVGDVMTSATLREALESAFWKLGLDVQSLPDVGARLNRDE